MDRWYRRAGIAPVPRGPAALAGSLVFAAVGITLAALVIRTDLRGRVVYAITPVLFSFIGVVAIKAASRQQ